MEKTQIQKQWEAAAPGWAKWEETIARWMEPATDVMLQMAGVVSGASVLDLASGAGSQTMTAARRAGATGRVVASDISDQMLDYVREQAKAAGLANVSTLAGAAEDLDLPAESFDAVICRLGLMLFTDPGAALERARAALKPDGKMSVVVVTTPGANPFLAEPMGVVLRHAGKSAPSKGQPGIFALGAPGVLAGLLSRAGYQTVETQTMSVPLRMASAADALEMMTEAFGAYRAVLRDESESVRSAAWAEVAEKLREFEGNNGFVAPTEVLIGSGTKPPA